MLNYYKTDKKLLVSILVQTCIRECHWYMPPFIHGDIQNKNKKVISSIYKTISGYRGRSVGWGAFFLNSFNNNQSLFSYLFLIIATAVAVLVGQYKSYLPVTCGWNQFQSLVLCNVQSIIAGFVWNNNFAFGYKTIRFYDFVLEIHHSYYGLNLVLLLYQNFCSNAKEAEVYSHLMYKYLH